MRGRNCRVPIAPHCPHQGSSARSAAGAPVAVAMFPFEGRVIFHQHLAEVHADPSPAKTAAGELLSRNVHRKNKPVFDCLKLLLRSASGFDLA